MISFIWITTASYTHIHTHAHSLTLKHTHMHSHTHTHTHAHSLSLSFSHSLSLCLSHTLSHTLLSVHGRPDWVFHLANKTHKKYHKKQSNRKYEQEHERTDPGFSTYFLLLWPDLTAVIVGWASRWVKETGGREDL